MRGFRTAGPLVVGLGGGGAPPFSPTDIANLVIWLKADSLALSDGTAVATWTDSSTSANNCTQATGTKQPIYKTGILNGNPILRFDGIDDSMGSSATVTNSGTQSLSVFFVASGGPDTSASERGLFVIDNNTGSGYLTGFWIERYADATTDYLPVIYNNNNQDSYNMQASGPGFSAKYLSVVKDFGVSMKAWVNGALVLTNTNATMCGSFTSNNYSVGRSGSTWKGDIAEIIVYQRAVTTTERQNVENYLKTKYGL